MRRDDDLASRRADLANHGYSIGGMTNAAGIGQKINYGAMLCSVEHASVVHEKHRCQRDQGVNRPLKHGMKAVDITFTISSCLLNPFLRVLMRFTLFEPTSKRGDHTSRRTKPSLGRLESDHKGNRDLHEMLMLIKHGTWTLVQIYGARIGCRRLSSSVHGAHSSI